MWSDNTVAPKEVAWSIGKAEVTVPTVSDSFIYDGTTKTPTATGYDSDAMIKSGDVSAINAGNYILTISLSNTNNYKFAGTNETSINCEWSIGKADGFIQAIDEDTGTAIYNNNTILIPSNGEKIITIQDCSGSIERISYGDGTIVEVETEGSSVVMTNMSAGTQNVIIYISASNNYNAYTFTVTIICEEQETIHLFRNSSNRSMHYKWNPKITSWDVLSDMDTFSQLYGKFLIYNNDIYYVGDNDSGNGDIYVYRYNNGVWDQQSTAPVSSYGLDAVVYDNCIHIFVGKNHYAWDGEIWTSVSTLPYSFNYGKAVVYNNEIHIMSNYSNGGTSSHYKYNGSSWSSVSTLPYWLGGGTAGSAIVFNNEIHILGSSNTTHDQKHYKWNGTSWVNCSTLPYHFEGGLAIVYDGALHILGGGYKNTSTKHYAWNGSSWTTSFNCPKYGGSGQGVLHV